MHPSSYGNQSLPHSSASQLHAYNNVSPSISSNNVGSAGMNRLASPPCVYPNGNSNFSTPLLYKQTIGVSGVPPTSYDSNISQFSSSCSTSSQPSYPSSVPPPHFSHHMQNNNMLNMPQYTQQSNMSPPPFYPLSSINMNNIPTAAGSVIPSYSSNNPQPPFQSGGGNGTSRHPIASPFGIKSCETAVVAATTQLYSHLPSCATPTSSTHAKLPLLKLQVGSSFSTTSSFFSSSTSSSHYPNNSITAYATSSADLTQQENLAREIQQCNALSTFIRCSSSRLPMNASLKQKSHLPVGLVIQPLAKISTNFPQVPTVNFGASVVRCRKCRTYINSFVSWEANGRRWICNLCTAINDTPQFYIHSLDEHGKREDRFERSELSFGSIEIIAPTDYMIRPPQPPTYMFVIDVSANAINSGMVAAVCTAIKQSIENASIGGGNTRTLIGLITFDSVVHFYNLNNSLSQPQLLVVSDLNELFLPMSNDILVNLYDSIKIINSVLDSLPNLWRNTKNSDNCLGSAVKAAYISMKHVGGKMCVFTSSPPTCGENSLKLARDDSSVGHNGSNKIKNSALDANTRNNKNDLKNNNNNNRETEFLKPANDSYFNLATLLTQSQVGVDLFVCVNSPSSSSSHSFVDLASLASLSKYTGGELRYYPNFNAHIHATKLKNEILHVLTRTTGWESVMRIRVSRGWKICSWNGHFYFRGNDLLVIPNCHENQTFSVTLDMEENVVQDTLVYVQSALLYTNCDGERRIRVHTYCLPVTSSYADMMSSMDAECVATLISQNAIQLALKSKLSDARTYIQNTCTQILSACSSISNCDAVKVLPLYILGMLKSVAFRDSKTVSSDMRIYVWHRLQNLSVEMTSAFFYPRMIQIHQMENEWGTQDDSHQIILPSALNLTNERLTQEGAYILEDGENMLLWIGRAIDPKWLESVFGVLSLEQIHPDFAESVIGSTGSIIGNRVNSIINALRNSRTPFMKLTLIRQGDANEHTFFSCLVEDRTYSCMMSLSEFLAKFGTRTQLTTPAIRPTSAIPRPY